MADLDLPDVPSLATIEPPAGGLARLQATLDAPPPRRAWRWLAVPAVALAGAALWLALRRDAAAPAVPAPARPELVADPAIGPSFYWVATTRPHPRPTISSVGGPPPTIDPCAAGCVMASMRTTRMWRNW